MILIVHRYFPKLNFHWEHDHQILHLIHSFHNITKWIWVSNLIFSHSKLEPRNKNNVFISDYRIHQWHRLIRMQQFSWSKLSFFKTWGYIWLLKILFFVRCVVSKYFQPILGVFFDFAPRFYCGEEFP